MYLVIDTETTNGFDDPITYDIGWAILDEDFNIIEAHSYVVADVFLDEKLLMKEAYFADKIPQYWQDIKEGTRELKTFRNIAKQFRKDCKDYEVEVIIAHNARFDYKSCSTTQRWLTSSRFRYFFPYGVMIADSLDMAKQVLAKDEKYLDFCKAHEGFMRSENYPRLTAEIIYRYLINDVDFQEKHTALEDVKIETQIAKYCLRNGAVLRSVWGD